ncbi:MAG: hypothetical protein J6W83_05720 [Bacteroidales bacterium]|nr:hypothetical protein [Bacteroidales bacterium]
MLRKIEIISDLLAMLMVLFITVVPHHHHQAMICLVHEECVVDHCCNDDHTNHPETDQEEQESHCVAHEKYCPSDNLRLEVSAPLAVPAAVLPCPVTVAAPAFHTPARVLPAYSPPPVLTWRINC